jgi:hypothetical protein
MVLSPGLTEDTLECVESEQGGQTRMNEDNSFRTSYIEGISKFQSARNKGFWQAIIDHLRGQPAELLSFDDIRHRLRLREESYRGLQDVPLDKIVGSVGRYRDFTRNFLPRSSEMQERWSRVYAQTNSMVGLPPVELYKVGDVYFVRDGNHRVSVARQIGAKTIQAHVTELPTSVQLEPGMSRQEIDAATAYAAFLEESGLARTRPHHQSLKLSEGSRYADLIGHIYLHKSLLEHIAGHEIEMPEAAIHWYDTVYRPAITLIRKYNMTELLNARTEGDLYLWLVEHLRELREQFGEEVETRKISQALANFLEKRHIPVPQELREEEDDTLILSRTQMMRALAEEDLPGEAEHNGHSSTEDSPSPAAANDEA